MRVIRGIMPAYAGVVELADARDSKSRVRKDVRVRPPPPAPKSRSAIGAARFCIVQQGVEPEGSWQSAGGALQPEAACAAAQVDPRHRHHVVASFVSLAAIFYALHKKHRALTPLLLLSESNPLRWASIRFLFFAKSVFVLRDFAFPRGCEPERENRLHYP